MIKMRHLTQFGLILILIFTVIFWICRYYSHRFFIENEARAMDMQKERIAGVMMTYHAYYHVWPSLPGPLNSNVMDELLGFQDAKINRSHINFFEKNNCVEDVIDDHGKVLWFSPNDGDTTCTVYEK